ncbi:serine/threonine-protein kinase [Nocardia acidivorans]|uniref:serine/threonine-protein kinase n=1 Tax=Nocardia acidivorans TaxID=404580 RepID=UPI000830FFF8|nr:serine/threonine-protein kinase [Nocardia acidivorans]
MGLRAGEVFSGFAIERLLGSGGMGAVYLARHPRLRRAVALKVLADTFTLDPKARNAFEREATLAAGLDHPNIVAVYDRSAVDDAALWLAMRYIDGGDAAGLLDRSPSGLEPVRAVRLVADAAHALDYAHGRGVLHRDVKPANLLIENDARAGERAVLTDFGIARTLDDTVTLSGIAATFAYAAPERFGETAADHRADIYSLGCTLFQLLTGQPPFVRRDQAAVIGAHLAAPPPSPRALRADLPAELDAVIATALAKSPGDRYPTCTALAEAAARALPAAAVTVRLEKPQPVEVSNRPPEGAPVVDTAASDTPPRRVEPGPERVAAPLPGLEPGPAPMTAGAVGREPGPAPVIAGAVGREPGPAPVIAGAVGREPGPAPMISGAPRPEPGHPSLPRGGVSTGRRRVAVVAGVLVTGIGVAVGGTLALRGGAESPASTPGADTSSAVVSQQVTVTATPIQVNREATSIPPPVDTPPADSAEPSVEQPRYTAPPVTRAQSPAAQVPVAPPVVPQTRAHQFGE